MNCSLLSKLLGLALACASSVALAQNESGAREVDPPTTRSETEEEEEEELEEWEIDFERRKAAFRPKRNYFAGGRCRFDWSLQPEKLLPGQTGVLKVMMIMQSKAVMRSGSDLKASQRQPAGRLVLGDVTVSPPRISNLAKAYEGKPIYDDWALLEIPITMAADAPLGSRQTAVLEADFELHDGVSGTSMGRYQQLIRVHCEAGTVSDPEVQEPGTSPPAPSGASEEAGRAGSPERMASAEDESLPGQAAQLDAEGASSSRPQGGDLPAEGSGTGLLVGAVLIAGVVLLLLFRRR